MYVELSGDGDPANFQSIPAKVYLKIRHLSASYFRDGNGEIKEYRQDTGRPVSQRTFHFNRLRVTDDQKCNLQSK